MKVRPQSATPHTSLRPEVEMLVVVITVVLAVVLLVLLVLVLVRVIVQAGWTGQGVAVGLLHRRLGCHGDAGVACASMGAADC